MFYQLYLSQEQVQYSLLFSFTEILENYQHHALQWEGTRRKLELDLYIPSLNLAFEYNGQQHYKDIGYFQPTHQYQTRDDLKQQACKLAGISLISVPYWWNRKKESLVATILKHNPQLAEHFNLSLPEGAKENFLDIVSKWETIPDIPPR